MLLMCALDLPPRPLYGFECSLQGHGIGLHFYLQPLSAAAALHQSHSSHGIYQMHPEYPNDHIHSLLKLADSRHCESIPSRDQCLFCHPRAPRGSYTKPPCSQCVKLIVRQ